MCRKVLIWIGIAALAGLVAFGCITEQQAPMYDHFQANDGQSMVPENTTATRGERADGVLISWDGIDGVDGYEIVRDGETIADVEGDGDAFLDETADAPQPPQAPYNVVTDGELEDGIAIDWDFDTPEPGDEHDYEIRGVIDDQSGDSSEPVTGYRGAYPVEFEVHSEADDRWYDAGDEPRFIDDSAPAGELVESGDAEATRGVFVDRVRLHLEGMVTEDGPENQYRVRAVDGVHDEQTSPEVTGRWTNVTPQITWQRSASDEADDFSDIAGATAASCDDTSAPADGVVRHWRAELTTPGQPTVLSGTDWGFRAIDCGIDREFYGDFDADESPEIAEAGSGAISGDANIEALWEATSPAFNSEDPQPLSEPIAIDEATVTATSSFAPSDDRPETAQFWIQDGHSAMRVHVASDGEVDDVEVGQKISFQATTMNVFNANPEVYELTDLSIDSDGHPVPVHDLRTEAITIDEHYYEVIRIGGRLESGTPCGGDYNCYELKYGTADQRQSLSFRTASDQISGGDCVTYMGPVSGFLGPKVVDDTEPEPQVQTDAVEWGSVDDS